MNAGRANPYRQLARGAPSEDLVGRSRADLFHGWLLLLGGGRVARALVAGEAWGTEATIALAMLMYAGWKLALFVASRIDQPEV